MHKNINEDNFLLLEVIARHRLSPEGIAVGLLGVLGFSFAMTLVVWNFTNDNSYITNPIWPSIFKLALILLAIQALITIFYFSEKRAYYFQKFQSVFLCFVTLKMTIEAYYIYFLLCEDRHQPQYMTDIGLMAMFGGFIFLLISIIRAFKRVKQGEFSRDGNGMFNFKNSKGFVSIPIIFGATMMGGVAARTLSSMETSFATVAEVLIPLFLAILVQYAAYLAWPEFLLLAYCKFRFTSFNISPPKQRKKKGAKNK